MALLIVVIAVVAAWVVISVPVALIVGRMSRRADLGSDQRTASPMLSSTGGIRGITGTVGALTR